MPHFAILKYQVIQNYGRGVSNYDSTNPSEERKITPIFQRVFGQHLHHLPTVPAGVRNGTAIISAEMPKLYFSGYHR